MFSQYTMFFRQWQFSIHIGPPMYRVQLCAVVSFCARRSFLSTGLSIRHSVHPSSQSCDRNSSETAWLISFIFGRIVCGDMQMCILNRHCDLIKIVGVVGLWLSVHHHNLVTATPLKPLDGFHSYLVGLFVVTCRCAYSITILIRQKLWDFYFLSIITILWRQLLWKPLEGFHSYFGRIFCGDM